MMIGVGVYSKTRVKSTNDFFLGGNNNRIIVISGPNAGGKTVALKTIALLVLMNQCGLPLPIKKASLPIFRNIFVDIGDEQSIEQSLSGFSSHMKNVSHILNQIDNDGVRALIVAPTKELVIQIKSVLDKFAKFLNLKVHYVYTTV